MDQTHFTEIIWQHHKEHRRPFPWRDDISPYRVFISEIMLQQTQTHRVLSKFEPFIERFPDFLSLANAPFFEVLALWKGLGYNRRALNLHKSAQALVNHHQGRLPAEPETLRTFPGIGPATACSIVTFAFNMPTIFLETNIRTVFIHHFFKNHERVHDKELIPLVTHHLQHHAPREWYYALMDYGSHLKKTIGNKSRQSAHYHRQSTFKGSDREIRGLILKALLEHVNIDPNQIPPLLEKDPLRVKRIITALCREGLVQEIDGHLSLASVSS